MRTLVAALRFLTRIPVPGPPTQAEDLPGAVAWFPLVGTLVGFATAGAFLGAGRLWPASVAGVLAVGFGLTLTGGFHEDGFTDAVDGLGGGWTRERVLEIMKDSRIGAYGSMALWGLLTLRWASLLALDRAALWALPLAMAWGRWSIALLLRLLPPIAEGLSKEVHRRAGNAVLAASTAALAAVLAALRAWRGPALDPWLLRSLAAVPATLLWALYLKRRLGGQSGDLLGAGNQVAEAAVLLALMAR